ncbi:MAG: hypothetical protein ACU85V_19075, partial [Gammaproteobacteria bacterium]
AAGAFEVEASEDGATVAAQSGKALAAITVTPAPPVVAPPVTEPEPAPAPEPDPEPDEAAATVAAIDDFILAEAMAEESPSAGDAPADDAPADAPVAEEDTPAAESRGAAEDEGGAIAAGGPGDAEAAALLAEIQLAAEAGIEDDGAGAITRAAAAAMDAELAALRADNERTASVAAGYSERMAFAIYAGLVTETVSIDTDLAYLNRYGLDDDAPQLLNALAADTAFLDELNLVREDINEVASFNGAFVGSTVALSTGISVGYVVWLARGGLLLASMLSSMPAWRLVDPLPILASLQENADGADGDSLAAMLERGAEAPPEPAQAPAAAPANGSWNTESRR